MHKIIKNIFVIIMLFIATGCTDKSSNRSSNSGVKDITLSESNYSNYLTITLPTIMTSKETVSEATNKKCTSYFVTSSVSLKSGYKMRNSVSISYTIVADYEWQLNGASTTAKNKATSETFYFWLKLDETSLSDTLMIIKNYPTYDSKILNYELSLGKVYSVSGTIYAD